MRASSKPSRLAALFLASALVAPALASPAVAADEANRLREVFESYLGTPAPGAPSPVTVTPLGGEYELAIDFDRLAAPLAPLGLELKLGRNLSRLTPKPDGIWTWRSDRFEPMTWAFQGRSCRFSVEGWRAEGDFSPALAAFTRQTATADRVVVDQTVPATGETPRLDVHKVDEGLAVTVAATPAAAGVDVSVDQTSRATTETFTVTEGKAAGIPDVEATLKVGPSHITGTYGGLRTAALLGLWRHLVAHHAPSDFTDGQVAFKQVLRDLGPVFTRATHHATVDAVEVETPVGFGSIGRVEATIDTTGAVADGSTDVAMTLTAFEIHSLFIPAWANRLIPRDLVLHGKVSDWNAAAALATFLDRADFAAHDPVDAAASGEILVKALPKGAVTIDLAGNGVKATDWNVALDGRLTAGLGGVAGEVTVRARGLETAATALRDPAAGEAGAKAAEELALALSFAESRDGALVWRFAFDGGAVSVNGRPLADAPKPPTDVAPAPAAPEPSTEKIGAKKEKSGGAVSVPAQSDDDEDDDSGDEGSSTKSSVKGGSTKK